MKSRGIDAWMRLVRIQTRVEVHNLVAFQGEVVETTDQTGSSVSTCVLIDLIRYKWSRPDHFTLCCKKRVNRVQEASQIIRLTGKML